MDQTRTDDADQDSDGVGVPVRSDWTPARVRDFAELYLRAVAIGAPAEALAVAIAEGVIESAGLHLAIEVLRGGPHTHARATELASKMLTAVVERRASEVNEKPYG